MGLLKFHGRKSRERRTNRERRSKATGLLKEVQALTRHNEKRKHRTYGFSIKGIGRVTPAAVACMKPEKEDHSGNRELKNRAIMISTYSKMQKTKKSWGKGREKSRYLSNYTDFGQKRIKERLTNRRSSPSKGKQLRKNKAEKRSSPQGDQKGYPPGSLSRTCALIDKSSTGLTARKRNGDMHGRRMGIGRVKKPRISLTTKEGIMNFFFN